MQSLLAGLLVVFPVLTSAALAQSPAATAVVQAPANGGALAAIRARGNLACAVPPVLPGHAAPDSAGQFQGIGAEICRALAAAVLGDASRVDFRPMLASEALSAVGNGQVDVMMHALAPALDRDVRSGVVLAAVTMFEGQGLLVPTASGITEPRGLDGKTVCASPFVPYEAVFAELAARQSIRLTPLLFADTLELRNAYAAGRCAAVLGQSSILAAGRVALTIDPAAHVVLTDLLSREQVGPRVSLADRPWRSAVYWAVNALIEAEELGITAANATAMRADPSPRIRRLLGAEPGLGAPLGLPDDWVFRMLRQTGNYGEIFERSLGQGSPFRIARGLNDLWSRGGLFYPIPMR